MNRLLNYLHRNVKQSISSTKWLVSESSYTCVWLLHVADTRTPRTGASSFPYIQLVFSISSSQEGRCPAMTGAAVHTWQVQNASFVCLLTSAFCCLRLSTITTIGWNIAWVFLYFLRSFFSVAVNTQWCSRKICHGMMIDHWSQMWFSFVDSWYHIQQNSQQKWTVLLRYFRRLRPVEVQKLCAVQNLFSLRSTAFWWCKICFLFV